MMTICVEAFIDTADYEDGIICFYSWPYPNKKHYSNNLHGPFYLAGHEGVGVHEDYIKNPRIYPINLPIFKCILFSLSKKEGWPWGDYTWFVEIGNFWNEVKEQHSVTTWIKENNPNCGNAFFFEEEIFYSKKTELGSEDFFLPKESRSSSLEPSNVLRKYTLHQRYKDTDKRSNNSTTLLIVKLAHSLIAQGLW